MLLPANVLLASRNERSHRQVHPASSRTSFGQYALIEPYIIKPASGMVTFVFVGADKFPDALEFLASFGKTHRFDILV
jgi:hypothetical protein